MKKRMTAVLLTIAMLCALLPAAVLPASADVVLPPDEFGDDVATGSCGESLTWSLNKTTGGLTIEGSGAMDDYASKYDTPWHDYCAKIIAVTISDGVTTIGKNAFGGCGDMAEITIPLSLTGIGRYAFSGCISLTDVYYAGSKTQWSAISGLVWNNSLSQATLHCAVSIDSGACGENLTWTMDSKTGTLTISGTGAMDDFEPTYNTPWQVYSEEIKTIVVGEGVTSIGDYAFENLASMTSLSLPDTLLRIGIYSFAHCSDLAALDLPENLMTIGDSAFTTCSSLECLVLPASLTSIGYNAFDNCFGLKSVTLPDGLTSIAQSMFSNCTGLTGITIPESVTNIGSSAFFNCAGLTSITIPGSVKTVGSSAFARCTALTSVTLEEGITEIGAVTFGNCTGITNITLPETLTAMGDGAFENCTGLTSISIPGGVTKLEEFLFDGCAALTSVTIPSYVTDIFYGAFRGCAALTDVYYEGTEAMWNKINIAQYNYYLTDANIHFASPEDCAHEHTHPDQIAPTCTESGFDLVVCDRCGTVLSETEVPALGHDFIEQGPMAPTCTMEGFSVLRTCSRCDYYYIEWIPALGHSWDDGVVTIPATETTDGEMTYTCTRCGVTMTEVIPATGETGCKHEHAYPEHKDATCTEDGYDRMICDDCGEIISEEVISALGHDIAVDEAIAPTCTATGLTAGEHCRRCDYKVAQEVVPMIAHDYKDGVCTVCGAKDPNYKPAEPTKFNDVKETAWYYDAVNYAVANGLMNGVGNNNFAPESPMTRAMLVTVLWRYENCPEAKASSFTDLTADWYKDAVAWAAENGIVNGVGDGRFAPNGNITREQMAAILYRYAQKKALDVTKRDDLKSFPDAGSVSAYARDAIAWAVAEKIIGGSDGKLLPQGNATRAQVATILMRFIEKFA